MKDVKTIRIKVPLEQLRLVEQFPDKSEFYVQAMYKYLELLQFCQQCKKKIGKTDDYMLKDEIWQQYGVGSGLLCFHCIENRIGRGLIKDDLLDVKSNRINPYTKNLF